MKDYIVLTQIKGEEGIHAPGETISLSDKEATELKSLGAIAEVEQAPELSTEERLAEIEVAISQLDTSNDDLWLRDGRPDIGALAALTGWKMTADERNSAWDRVKPAE